MPASAAIFMRCRRSKWVERRRNTTARAKQSRKRKSDSQQTVSGWVVQWEAVLRSGLRNTMTFRSARRNLIEHCLQCGWADSDTDVKRVAVSLTLTRLFSISGHGFSKNQANRHSSTMTRAALNWNDLIQRSQAVIVIIVLLRNFPFVPEFSLLKNYIPYICWEKKKRVETHSYCLEAAVHSD